MVFGGDGRIGITWDHQALRARLRELERQMSEATDLQSHLRKARADEPDAARKFRYERQIEEIEQENSAREDERLEVVTDLLYGYLLKLDYRSQNRAFRQMLQNRFGLLLVNGPLLSGQRWLLNRLVRDIQGSTAARRAVVDFGRLGRSITLPAVLRETAKRLGILTPSSSSEEGMARDVVVELVKQWKTRHVFLVFRGVHQAPADLVIRLLQQLWKPLSTEAVKVPPGTKQLLVFLEGIDADVAAWQMDCIDTECKVFTPGMPLHMSLLSEMPDEELMDWLETQGNELPEPLDSPDVATIVAKIQQGGKAPESILAEICSSCGGDYYRKENAWLTI